MITKMNHVVIYVLDQESAYDFYVNKLGLNVHTDAPMGPGKRWLTVTPPEQPDLEIALMAIDEELMPEEKLEPLGKEKLNLGKNVAEQMRELVKRGAFGFGVFECNDLLATYEELSAKGVEFTKPPTKEFYGYEALFKDDSGNWFSLGQKEETV